MNKYTALENGLKVPNVAMGTYQLPDDETTVLLVKEAIAYGYRHFDCSPSYYNAKSISKGFFSSGVKREELCICTKARNRERGREKTYQGCLERMKDLGVDYLDVYLLHWPASIKDYENWQEVNRDTWLGMIDLYKDGLVRAIGVCNFLPHHLECIMDMEIKPMIDQIEFHPGYWQKETYDYCKDNGIVVEAHTPLGGLRKSENETLKQLAEKYQKTPEQVTLRWELQKECIVLPKSSRIERVRNNYDVYDFRLSDEDMKRMDKIPYYISNGQHPDSVSF